MEQMPLFMPDSEWRLPEHLPDRLEGTIGYDTETKDPHLKTLGPGWATGDGKIVGVSLAAENFKGYFPIAHERGQNMDKGIVTRWLKHILSDDTQPKVMANASYDIGWTKKDLGIDIKGPIIDVQAAACLLDENRKSYSLDSLLKSELGSQKDETLLREAAAALGIHHKKVKDNLYRIPCEFVGPYAEQDAAETLRLWLKQKEMMEQPGNEGLLELMKLECGLISLLVKMRMRGVPIDEARAEKAGKEFEVAEKKCMAEIKKMTGLQVEIWSARSIAQAFDEQQLPYPKTEQGEPSFVAEWLEAQEHKLPTLIRKARQFNKGRTTFTDNVIQGHTINGRIHAQFHPLRSDDGGAITGRFSSSDPNLQFIPSRNEDIAPIVRAAFLPEDGCVMGSFDYSEQEPRVLVHYAALVGAAGAEEAVRYYMEDPKASFHTFVAGITGLPRPQAKIINLALFYAMGGAKLCRRLGLPTEWIELRNGARVEVAGPEGKAILKIYNERLPFVKDMQDRLSERANDRGHIITLLKRRCRFNLWEPAGRGHVAKGKALLDWQARREWPGQELKRAYTHKALNSLVQGSSADMIKQAMYDLDREGILPAITVHDEVVVPTESEAQAKRIKEIMINCVQLRVPLKLDAEFGTNWGSVSKEWDWRKAA